MTRERGIALHSGRPGAATNNLDGDGVLLNRRQPSSVHSSVRKPEQGGCNLVKNPLAGSATEKRIRDARNTEKKKPLGMA